MTTGLGIATDGYDGGGGGGGGSGMAISNITPDIEATPGTPGAFSSVFSIARLTPIEFDLTMVPSGCQVTIAVKYPDRDETYVALDVEGAWQWPFDVYSSIGDLGAEPVHVVLLPRGGWRSGYISFKVAAAFEATGAPTLVEAFDPDSFDGGSFA